jgi:photosystem II stability/assembly factor-like uncharacterized protein
MATKTYYVSRTAGFVHRLDDFTLPWVDVSNSHTDGFLDVMAVPDTPDSVIVVGRDSGIYWSNDAGVSWTQAVGTYTSLGASLDFREIWIVDPAISFVTGGVGGAILKSIDGGVTFDQTPTFPTGSGGLDGDFTATAIHFINAGVGVVSVELSGNGTAVFKTSDGGATWTWLQGGGFVGGAPGTLTNSCGIHLSADEQTIVVVGAQGIYRSTDAGATFSLVEDLTLNTLFGSGRHLTWIDDTTLWVSGLGDTLRLSSDSGATWSIVRPYNPVGPAILGAHFYDASNGFLGGTNNINTTGDSGATTTLSEAVTSPNAIWTVSDVPPPVCYILRSCDFLVYPDITDVVPDAGVDLMAVTGQVINTLDVFGTPRCYTVELQEEPCVGPNLTVLAYTLVGSDCAIFSLDTCPTEIPVTLVGESVIVDVMVNNLSAETHDFVGSFGSCTASGMTILNPGLTIAAGESGTMQIQYTPTGAEDGQCELIVTGPCGEIVCDLCYRAVAVPACSHFNICVTGPSCAPDCIQPGEVIQFNLGGSISPVAYPTIITFSVVNQVTQEIVFAADYPIVDDAELDAILVNVPGLLPGKYCAEVCLPGCNAKRVLCFDVCEPFDIYKDSCNHWHVHRPSTCQIEEYLVTVRPMECGAPEDVVVDDVLWDVLQDNTFEFEVPEDGIYIFEMKDPLTGEVQYSFAAFETCKLQECFKIMMDKIMCSCSDPCCKRCDGSPEKEREFSRMSLNKLVPLYMTYLGMARRNELYTVGM